MSDFLDEFSTCPAPYFCQSETNDPFKSDSVKVSPLQLKQHPEVNAIWSKFDAFKKRSEASIAEVVYFDSIQHSMELYLLFGTSPCSYVRYYSFMTSNVFAHTIYMMAENKEISLYSFDASATLSDLIIDVDKNTSVSVPFSGKFVVEFSGKDDEEGSHRLLVLELERHNHEVQWAMYSKADSDYFIFADLLKEAYKKYNYYRNKVFDMRGNLLKVPYSSFNDIYLDKALRTEIQTNIIDYIDENSLKLKKLNGLPTKRGVILVGPPGTGKTHLTRILARELKTTFMIVSDLKGVEQLIEVFSTAAQFERIVVLFEDIDIYIKDRDSGCPLLSTLLNKLDGIEENNHILVLCTTNDVETLDEALNNRPGRFDRVFVFDYPSPDLKIEMLRGFCKDKDVSNVDFDSIISVIPKNYTGAHLKEVYITACNNALMQKHVDASNVIILSTELFLNAVEEVKHRPGPARIGFGGTNG